MNTRALRCLLRPPFHHDWKLAENLDPEDRNLGRIPLGGPGWADPTVGQMQEFHMRCARCGKDTWFSHSAADPNIR